MTNFLIRFTLEEGLKDRGYETQSAGNGEGRSREDENVPSAGDPPG